MGWKWSVLLLVLGGWGSATAAIASPAPVFRSHLERIQQSLPPRFVLRLPTRILLGGPADEEFINSLKVRVWPSEASASVTVGLYSCEGSPRCLIGTFSVASSASIVAQEEYDRHRNADNPIQLRPNLHGYFLPQSSRSSLEFSSVTWQQDGMVYTVRFPEPERQNMLYMAVSMANNEPIYALNPILRTVQPQPLRPQPLSQAPR